MKTTAAEAHRRIRFPFRRLALPAVLALAAAALAAAEPAAPGSDAPAGLLVNNPQDGAISAIAVDTANGWLGSASADGSVLVYAASGELLQRLQVSCNPLSALALGADGRLAAIEKIAGGRFRLSVWDWQAARQLWNAELDDQPLSLRFSPKGNYLTLTLARWNSLLFVEAASGKVVPWLAKGFGILDYALLSSKEERLLSYHPASGTVAYHDLASGAEIKRLTTKLRLRQFQLVPEPSRTRAVAIDGTKLVSVDALSGKILDTKDPGFAPTRLLCDEANPGRVLAAAENDAGLRLQWYDCDPRSGALSPGPAERSSLANCSSLALFAGNAVAGDGAGRLYLLLGNDKRQAFAERAVAPVRGLAFAAGSLYLSGDAGLLKLAGDWNGGGDPLFTLGRPAAQAVAGLPAGLGMTAADERRALLWDRGRNPKLYVFDAKTDQTVRVSPGFANSFLKVKCESGRAWTIDTVGAVRGLDLADFRVAFSHATAGALSVEPIGKGEVLVGKAAESRDDSALVRVNAKTGETVLLPCPDQAAFACRYLAKDDSLVYLASAQQGGKAQIGLKKIGLGPAGGGGTIQAFAGEDNDGELCPSQDGALLFASAGGSPVSAWDGQTVWTFEESGCLARGLRSAGRLLAALNRDGTVCLWDIPSRRFLLRLAVLADGSCLALDRHGAFDLLQPAKRSADDEAKARRNALRLLSLPYQARGRLGAVQQLLYPAPLLQ